MATKFKWVGETLAMNFGSIAGNSSGISSSVIWCDKKLSDNLTGVTSTYFTDTDAALSDTIQYENPTSEATITGYINWKSGGHSNIATASDKILSYYPVELAVYDNIGATEIYNDALDGKFVYTQGTNSSYALAKVTGSTINWTIPDTTVVSLNKTSTANNANNTITASTTYVFNNTGKSAATFTANAYGGACSSAHTYLSNVSQTKTKTITIKNAVKSISAAKTSTSLFEKIGTESITYTLTGFSKGAVADPHVSATSSNNNVATATVSGGKVTITAKEVSATSTATITLTATGATTSKSCTISVTVTNVANQTVSLNTGDVYTYGLPTTDIKFSDGTTTSENTYAKATISGDKLTITAKSPTSTAQVFTLSTGTTITVTVTNITLTIS
jgi:hypothetical protein